MNLTALARLRPKGAPAVWEWVAMPEDRLPLESSRYNYDAWVQEYVSRGGRLIRRPLDDRETLYLHHVRFFIYVRS